jgi:DNA-binding NarL/FixJ family response regulator
LLLIHYDQLPYIRLNLLFLDLDMPYKNGLQCILEIRSHPVLNRLPNVVCSSTNRPSSIQTAYELGAHLVFLKTNDLHIFSSALLAILQMDWENPEDIKKQYMTPQGYSDYSRLPGIF